jgi:hypothetical protein
LTIITYHISNKESEEKLIKHLEKKFHRNRSYEDKPKYFAFAGRDLSAIYDTLKEIMDHLRLKDTDYIALYYTREEEPDEIKRLMIFGKSYLLEKELNNVNERIVTDLLEIDFIREYQT